MLARIAPQFLESVIYLYPSKDAAKDGKNAGGSGFIVGVTSEQFADIFYLYAVTNRHVIEDGQSRTIRINTTDGKTDVLDTSVDAWTISRSDDLAVMLFSLDQSVHKYDFIPDKFFLTHELVDRLK